MNGLAVAPPDIVFNIGVSTSSRGDFTNNWKDPYRHWCFKSKNSIFDSSLTKNSK